MSNSYLNAAMAAAAAMLHIAATRKPISTPAIDDPTVNSDGRVIS
jgi:hypothetical protein